MPTAFAFAQEDEFMPDTFRAEVEEILRQKSNLPYKILLTDETSHGFASRPDPDNPIIMKAFHQVNDLIAEWAKIYL